MRNLAKCLVCLAEGFDTVYESTFSGGAEEAPRFFLNQRTEVAHGRIVRCRSCGFVFTNPQFKAEEYSRIYAQVASEGQGNDVLAPAEALRFARLARLIESRLHKPQRLLDFGCADGGFLARVKAVERIGYEVGDPSTKQVDGYRIITGDFIHDAGHEPLSQGSFDAVTAWDVFEHLPDLDEHVSAISKIIAPQGLLFVTVPNIDSIIAKISGGRWNMFLLEHLWYFSPSTLERFLSRHGFASVEQGNLPFEVTLAHFANRFRQTYGVDFSPLIKPAKNLVIPLPIGLMYAIYQRRQ
ncbi:MAG TPA: class I SAM-dependent methyltransferase [Candidatus Obscuribacterales bacterium]